VISEARKGLRADPGVRAFWTAAERDDSPLFLAAVTVGELRRGVELIRHRGDQPQAQSELAPFPQRASSCSPMTTTLRGSPMQDMHQLRGVALHAARRSMFADSSSVGGAASGRGAA